MYVRQSNEDVKQAMCQLGRVIAAQNQCTQPANDNDICFEPFFKKVGGSVTPTSPPLEPPPPSPKVLVVLFGVLALGDPITPLSSLGVAVAIGGGLWCAPRAHARDLYTLRLDPA